MKGDSYILKGDSSKGMGLRLSSRTAPAGSDYVLKAYIPRQRAIIRRVISSETANSNPAARRRSVSRKNSLKGQKGLAPSLASTSLEVSGHGDWIGCRPSAKSGIANSLQKTQAAFRGTDAKSFRYQCILGRGAAGTVRLVQHRSNKKFYALKCMRRSNICHRRAAERTKREIEMLRLARFRCPFLVHCFHEFQDKVHIYLMLEYAAGGELYGQITKHKRLAPTVVCFYAAEILSALQFIHSQSFAYRDLKPDNVLIDQTGHVLLADFGLVRPVSPMTGLVQGASAGGTCAYLAPEITRGHKEAHGISVDFWALGIVMFECLTGKPPFGDKSKMAKYEVFQRINKGNIKYPSHISGHLRELLKGLLCKRQEDRFGFPECKNHPWFSEVDWTLLEKRGIAPPWVPDTDKIGDHANFAKWREPKYATNNPLSSQEMQYSDILSQL